ncbi:MAG: DUF1326 domain-containing protein [Gaiellaceae bacterium]
MADWKVKGTVLVACNCDFGCPCNFNAPPTTGDCEGSWTWHIEQGNYGEVSLDGLTLGVYADWPRAIHEGGGKAVVYYDERADEKQREALETLARGEAGGPWGVFINTYELVGVHPAPFEVELAAERSRLKVGDVVELQMEPIKNPVSGAETRAAVVLPEGLVFNEGWCATSTHFSVKGEVEFDHTGKNTEYATFEYAGA